MSGDDLEKRMRAKRNDSLAARAQLNESSKLYNGAQALTIGRRKVELKQRQVDQRKKRNSLTHMKRRK